MQVAVVRTMVTSGLDMVEGGAVAAGLPTRFPARPGAQGFRGRFGQSVGRGRFRGAPGVRFELAFPFGDAGDLGLVSPAR